MACNTFGQIFRMTTFGESHGKGVGVVVDGCPANLFLSARDIEEQLAWRRPGHSAYTSARKEEDSVEILSGVFEGKTTGAPIALLIRNQDVDSSAYEALKDVYRPGHAQFTYLEKFGIFDYRGGGRASARETAARVAAGAIAKKLLAHFSIECVAFVLEIGGVTAPSLFSFDVPDIRKKTYESPVFCPDLEASSAMMQRIEQVRQEKDSVGGILGCTARLPVGLGEPMYYKLEAALAFAMLSLPAAKGFEIGAGFASARMQGSAHNDLFDVDGQGNIYTTTNHAGGILGGISTGSPLFFKVAFKPTSTIQQMQSTVNRNKEKVVLRFPDTARHDPCVAVRAVPVVEAMTALVLADLVLLNRCARL